jgi:hypothetical protein
MDTGTLRATLTRLHDELARSPELDGESRRLLHEVSADIGAALAPRPRATAGVGGSGAPLPGAHAPKLEELATRFESTHPALAALVRDVADALSRVGV